MLVRLSLLNFNFQATPTPIRDLRYMILNPLSYKKLNTFSRPPYFPTSGYMSFPIITVVLTHLGYTNMLRARNDRCVWIEEAYFCLGKVKEEDIFNKKCKLQNAYDLHRIIDGGLYERRWGRKLDTDTVLLHGHTH